MAAGDLGLLDECIAWYDFSASGYSGGKLLDQKGNCDLDFVNRGSSSPVFNTRDGNACTDFDDTFYYEGKSLMMPGFSVVLTGVQDTNSVVRYMIYDFSLKANSGNFDANPYDNTDTETLNSTYRGKGLYTFADRFTLNDRTGESANSANFTPGSADLITAVVSIADNENQIAKGTDAFTVNAYANSISAFNSGNIMRIGFLTAAGGGIVPPYYNSLIKAYFFMGDVTQNPDFAQARLDEIASL